VSIQNDKTFCYDVECWLHENFLNAWQRYITSSKFGILQAYFHRQWKWGWSRINLNSKETNDEISIRHSIDACRNPNPINLGHGITMTRSKVYSIASIKADATEHLLHNWKMSYSITRASYFQRQKNVKFGTFNQRCIVNLMHRSR